MMKKIFLFLTCVLISRLVLASDFTESERYASLVVNADNGKVIYQKDAAKKLYPASLTKMMTLYVTFNSLQKGKLRLNQSLTTSHRASMMPRSNLNLRPGQKITVKDAIYALIVHSANDVAVVLAEAQSGSIEAFSYEMNKVAEALGMKDTNFANPHGLPNEEQVTTAFDMARLAIALRRDHAKYYEMFSRTSFSYNGKVFNSHNRVLKNYKYADGLKTGYINASGFNLVTSTNAPFGKLIGVVFGGPTAAIRDRHMIELLQRGYRALGVDNNLEIEAENESGVFSSIKDIAKNHKPKSAKIKVKRKVKKRKK